MKIGYVITWKITHAARSLAVDITSFGTVNVTYTTWTQAIEHTRQASLNDAVESLGVENADVLKATVKFMHTQAL